jgi:hypothetical protein
VAIDDATRLAYVEALADEQKATAIGFLSRAMAWFNGQGMECRQVMSDNGPAYISRSFAKACKAIGTSTSAPGFTCPAPTARLSASSRPSVKKGPMPWPSRTPRNATTGCRDTYRSLTGSGSTQPSTAHKPAEQQLWCSCSSRNHSERIP